MKKSIEDLNNVLFDTLEKLQKGEIENAQAKSIVDISTAIAKNTSLQLQAFKLTNGQTSAPQALMLGVTYATIGSSDVYAQKTEFAKKKGYKNVTDAVGDLGLIKFNKMFQDEFLSVKK